MTSWERHIVDVFLARYPLSAAAAGGRPLRIPAEGVFPQFEQAPLDDRESFLEAAESLERQGILTLVWNRRLKHEVLRALVCRDSAALFALAGKPSPSALAEGARRTAEQAIRDTGPAEGVSWRAFFGFMAQTLDAEDAARGIDAQAVADLAALVRRIRDGGTGGLTPRALSVSLYADSKRLETVMSLFSRVMNRAERRGIPVPRLAVLGRSLPETFIAGRLAFGFTGLGDNGNRAAARLECKGGDEEASEESPAGKQAPLSYMENSSGLILGFPLQTIQRMTAVACLGSPTGGGRPRVLGVENKETFYVLAESAVSPISLDFDALLYVGGHLNEAVRALAGRLAAAGFEFFHAGDLDPDGILILQELGDAAGTPVLPLLMDQLTFDRYSPWGKTLEPGVLKRISLIPSRIRALPGIEGLIRRIEETGMGIEQEIIDYRAPAALQI